MPYMSKYYVFPQINKKIKYKQKFNTKGNVENVKHYEHTNEDNYKINYLSISIILLEMVYLGNVCLDS